MVNFLYLKISTLFYVLAMIVLSAFSLFTILQGIALHSEWNFQMAFLLYLTGFTALVVDVWCYYRFRQLSRIWINKGILLKMPSIVQRKNTNDD